MADGTSAAPNKAAKLSNDEMQKLYGRLLNMLSLAEILQAAATGDMDMKEAGIYGTAALLEEQANEAIAILGI